MHILPFPSFSISQKAPSLDMAKLTPLSPSFKPSKSFLKCSLATAFKLSGSSFSKFAPNFSLKISPISWRFLCIAGTTICKGGSSLSCKISSPRSVSIAFKPFFSK